MNRERLRLVTDFATLKAGDRIFDIACECGRFHEAVLIALEDDATDADGPDDANGRPTWEVLPNCTGEGPDEFTGIDSACVAANRIFVVEDGVSESAAIRKSVPRPLERVR